MPEEPSVAMKHLTAELGHFMAELELGAEALAGDEIYRKHVELLERYGPQMTIEERVQFGGGFYTRVEPIKE